MCDCPIVNSNLSIHPGPTLISSLPRKWIDIDISIMAHNKTDSDFTHNILAPHIQKQFKIIYYFNTINLKMGGFYKSHLCVFRSEILLLLAQKLIGSNLLHTDSVLWHRRARGTQQITLKINL